MTDIFCGNIVEARYRSSIAWADTTGLLPYVSGNTTTYLWQLKSPSATDTLVAPATPALCQISGMSQEDYDALIAVTDTTPFYRATLGATVAELRAELITEVWSGDGYPTGGVDSIVTGITCPLDVFPSNLLRTDRLTITVTGNGVEESNNDYYMVYPTAITANGHLALMHSGHSANDSSWNNDLSNESSMAKELVEAGYTVALMHMPFYGGSSGGTVTNHNESPAPTQTLNYLRFFTEHCVRVINHFEGSFDKIFMTGHSGGGWTTTVLAAMDTRILASAQSGGSYPAYFSDDEWGGPRDWEQELVGLTVGYLDLYIMACDGGRKQLQCLSSQDDCCFPGDQYTSASAQDQYLDVVQAAVGSTDFDMLIVTSTTHQMHPTHRAAIVALFDSM